VAAIEQPAPPRPNRIRLGIVLMLLSWVPAPIVVWAASSLRGVSHSSETQHELTVTVWTVEVLVGLFGVWLAGSEAVGIVKSVGWRRTPGIVWRLVRHGG
jgi:hypothetical protein